MARLNRYCKSAMLAVPTFLFAPSENSAQLGFVFREVGYSGFPPRKISVCPTSQSSSATMAIPVFLPGIYGSAQSVLFIGEDGGFRFPL